MPSTVPLASAPAANVTTARDWARGAGADVGVVVPVSDWQSAVPGDDTTAGTAKPRARRSSTSTRGTGTTRAPGTGTKRVPTSGTDAAVPDITDLLVPGRAIARTLASSGQRLTRDALLAGLQERGRKASARRVGILLAALRDEAAMTTLPPPPAPAPAPSVAATVSGVPAARAADVPVMA